MIRPSPSGLKGRGNDWLSGPKKKAGQANMIDMETVNAPDVALKKMIAAVTG